MVETASTMLELGTQAPDFTLTDAVSGNQVSRSNFAGQPLLVAFICNHCPFVKHLADELAAFGAEYQKKGLAVVGISSNDVENYPDDAPEKMREEAERRGYTFPYLFDETQEVARAYRAACTPDFFLFDARHRLAYRGQFDDTRPRKEPPQRPTGADLRAAADTVLAGRPVEGPQRPSVGCNIKWRAGQEPDYART